MNTQLVFDFKGQQKFQDYSAPKIWTKENSTLSMSFLPQSAPSLAVIPASSLVWLVGQELINCFIVCFWTQFRRLSTSLLLWLQVYLFFIFQSILVISLLSPQAWTTAQTELTAKHSIACKPQWTISWNCFVVFAAWISFTMCCYIGHLLLILSIIFFQCMNALNIWFFIKYKF